MAGLNQLKRNVSDLVIDPRGYLEMIADRMHNSVMGQKAVERDGGLGMVKLTPDERRAQIQQALLDSSGSGSVGGALGIIKNKGGNWLTGSVEDALRGLKQHEPIKQTLDLQPELVAAYRQTNPQAFDASQRAAHLNKWIEGPLTKYVKRDMATEGDPVRKLAEQGVLHYSPDAIARNVDSATYANRGAAGFPPWGMGQSDLAKSWENLSDRSVMGGFAGRMSEAAKAQNPWLEKLAAEDRVYQPSKIGHEGLGFGHLTDELRNALNPDSGLPRNLQLTPEQMQQMGMEKAVRHVAAINDWRAAQQAELNAKLAGDHPAVHRVREYAENNPKGLRWVEIKQPKELPEGWTATPVGGDLNHIAVRRPDGELMGYGQTQEEAAQIAHKASGKLREQLKYEGDTMGHCAGGYCDDVIGGQSRIFSLRDAKGEPHVTIETTGPFDTQGYDAGSHDILQIKGKQNKKPNDEYLPFVQDFVKNHPEGGQWGTVGDLGNSGLRRSADVWNDLERETIAHRGHEIPSYVLPGDIEAINKQVWPDDSAYQIKIPPTQGYANGGLVEAKPEVWEPIEADGVMGYLLR